LQSLIKSLKKRQLEMKSILPENQAALIVGDFNETKEQTMYQMLTKGRLSAGFCDPVFKQIEVTKSEYTHEYKFNWAYQSHQPDFTLAIKGLSPEVLDFIYYSSNSLKTISVMQVIGDDKKEIMRTYLPNNDHGSDHLPVGAVIEMIQVPVAVVVEKTETQSKKEKNRQEKLKKKEELKIKKQKQMEANSNQRNNETNTEVKINEEKNQK